MIGVGQETLNPVPAVMGSDLKWTYGNRTPITKTQIGQSKIATVAFDRDKNVLLQNLSLIYRGCR